MAEALGPCDPLKRAVKIRAGLVHRRTTAMARLDCVLEILGPDWVEALGSRMRDTTFKFLAAYANPHQVKRLGAARLARWFQHHTRKAWGPERARTIIAAAEATLALWGNDGLDFEALPADIAAEASIALEVSEQITLLDRRIHDLYTEADPKGIVLSVPGVGEILAGQILGRLGDPTRFTTLAGARAFSGARSSTERLQSHRPVRRAYQAWRCMPESCAVPGGRPGPQGRSPARRSLPAAHVRYPPAPHLGDLQDRRSAAHPDRGLPPQRNSL